jgi:type VI secretion system protein ImpG
MSENIYRHFEKELEYLYGAARDIALKYPQSSKSLGIDRVTPETADPFLKQLLEGVAFLSARVHKRIDESSESYGRRLLELVCPGLVAPVPSFAVLELQPVHQMFIPENPLHSEIIERGHIFSARADSAEITLVSCHNVELLPIRLQPTVLISAATDYRHLWGDKEFMATHAARFELSLPDNIEFSMLNVDRLPVYLKAGNNAISAAVPIVLQTLMLSCKGIRVLADGMLISGEVAEPKLEQLGFDDADALLPVESGVFSSDRLLREYFAFPERFNFLAFSNLLQVFQATHGQNLTFVVFFDSTEIDTDIASVEQIFQSVEFSPYCTPVANLFPKSLEMLEADHRNHEHFVLASKTERINYEVHSIRRVVGNTARERIEFSPYYSELSFKVEDRPAFYSVRRESADSASESAVTNHEIYQPCDMFLSLVDEHNKYLSFEDSIQLSIDALCTNRALLVDGSVDLSRTPIESVEGSGFLGSINLLDGPTRPVSCASEDDQVWRLVGILSRNYRSVGSIKHQGAPVASPHHLKSVLDLFATSVGCKRASSIEGLLDISVSHSVRSMIVEGVNCVGRGLVVTVVIDQNVFSGNSTYLFCMILEKYLSRQVSINTFMETVFVNNSGKEIARWKTSTGRLPLI